MTLQQRTESAASLEVIRDEIRGLMALVGMDVRADVQLIDERPVLVLAPMREWDARKLADLMDTSPMTASEGLPLGAAMWSASRKLVGEVVAGGPQRVKLKALVHGAEFWSELVDLRPATLHAIDAARRTRLHGGGLRAPS
jgi:hypothetical protein